MSYSSFRFCRMADDPSEPIDLVLNEEKMDSLEMMEENHPINEGFIEDYNSVREGTLIDKEISSDANLRSHPVVDEFFALDNEWEKKEPTEELNEKIIQRLELEALIKRAQDKLLPEENIEEVKPDDKLNRIESSEDEGFHLRLSCIMEESDSESGSCVPSKTKILIPLSPTEEASSFEIHQSVEENEAIAESLELDRPVESDCKKTDEKKKSFKRGRSAEPRHCIIRSDCCDTVSLSEKNVFRSKISRRGRSLESGLVDKSRNAQQTGKFK